MKSKIDPNTGLYGNFTRLDILYGPIKENCNENKKMTETLSLCKHHIPVKLGICADCAKEHENNLLKSQLKSLEEKIVNIESSQLCQQLDPQIWFHVNERLDKLESLADFEKIKLLIWEGAKTHASILECETKLKELEKQIIEMRGLSLHPTKPHKCPVCYGRGFREDQFLKQHKCHNCECTGVIWG